MALTLFIVQLLLWLAIGRAQVTTYLISCVLLGLAFFFNFHFGLYGSARFTFTAKTEHGERTRLQSKNALAPMAAIHADRSLTPMTRPLLIPVRGSLLTLVLLSGLGWAWIVILLVLIQLMTGPIVKGISSLEFSAGQLRRDRAAATLLAAVRSGKPARRKYYLYLRPFAITGQIHAEDPNDMDLAVKGRHTIDEYSEQGEKVGLQIPVVNLNLALGEQRSAWELNPEWEAIFEKGFRQLGELVALGRPGESIGAGRILAGEEDWQKTLVELSHEANGFFVIPSSHPGTLWEIRWLKDTHAFRSCYFFMPGPQLGRDEWSSWQGLKEKLSPILRLPHHLGVPAMFALDGDGRPHVVPVVGTMLIAGGAMRDFIKSTTIENALVALSAVAARSRESEIRAWVQLAEEFVDVLARGRESLLGFPRLNADVRHSLLDLDTPALSRLWGASASKRIPETEEVFYQARADQHAPTVRQDVMFDDERFVFYVTLGDSGGPTPWVVGFGFLPYKEDLSNRMQFARSISSSGTPNLG